MRWRRDSKLMWHTGDGVGCSGTLVGFGLRLGEQVELVDFGCTDQIMSPSTTSQYDSTNCCLKTTSCHSGRGHCLPTTSLPDYWIQEMHTQSLNLGPGNI